jgi:hypothetical protein
MLLMSWAGEQAREDLMSSIRQDINEETTRAVTKLRYHGVEHCDVRPPNVLWNSEGGNIILVDLERSEIMKRVPALQETSPNKHLCETRRLNVILRYLTDKMMTCYVSVSQLSTKMS